MSVLQRQNSFTDQKKAPLSTGLSATLRPLADAWGSSGLLNKLHDRARVIVKKTEPVVESCERIVKSSELTEPHIIGLPTSETQLLDLWSVPFVRAFFMEKVRDEDPTTFLSGVLALLDGHFIDFDLKMNRPALVCAACCFVLRGQVCHLLVSSEADLADLSENYGALFSHLNIALLLRGDAAEVSAEQAVLQLALPQDLLSDYVANTPYRTADFHQKAISSHFGDKKLVKPFSGVDVVLVDQAERCLLDSPLKPLIIQRPRELAGLEPAITAVMEWASSLPDTDYSISEDAVEYTGSEAIAESSAFSSLERFWRSERLLSELSVHALKAFYLLERGKHYQPTDDALLVLDPDSGKPIEGRGFPDWLRQCLEHKEGMPISPVNEVLLRKTYQLFFRERKHFAGSGFGLSMNRKELWMLFRRRVACTRKLKPEGFAFNDVYFEEKHLKEGITTFLTINPSVEAVFCPDRTLAGKISEFLPDIKTGDSTLTLLGSLYELNDFLLSSEGSFSEEQLLVIGSSATGRDELFIKQFLGKPVNRMLQLNSDDCRGLGHCLPRKLRLSIRNLQISYAQRLCRGELLSEQLKNLKSDYGLRDQWI